MQGHRQLGHAEATLPTQLPRSGAAWEEAGVSVTGLHSRAGNWGEVWDPAKAFMMLGEISF